MGATLSNTALSRQLINESRRSSDPPIEIKAKWSSHNHNTNDFAVNRICALSDYYDYEMFSTSIGRDDCQIILHFYNKNHIKPFKTELKTTHPGIKVL